MKAIQIALLSLILPACGNDDDGPRGQVDPLTTVDGLCAAWGKAACNADVARRCGAASVEDCVEAQADFCVERVGDGPFVASESKACGAAVKAAYADAEIDLGEWRDVVLGVEGACADLNPQLEGAGGAGSDGNDTAAPLEGGADCDPATDVCEPTHYCDTARRICRPRAKAGEACCENDPKLIAPVCRPVPCVSSAYCSGASGSQVCVALGGISDECTTDAECGSGLFCVDAAGGKVCTDTVFLGTGAPLCDDLR